MYNMRFHIGFSKRIDLKTILFLLGALFVGLLSFFGLNTTIVFAENKVVAPSNVYYKSNTVSPYQITPNVTLSGDLYVYNPNNSGSAAFDFTTIYSLSNVCSTGRGSVEFKQYGMYNSSVGMLSGYFNIQYTDGSDIGRYQITSSSGNWYNIKTDVIDFSKNLKFTMNTSSGNVVNGVYYSKILDINCVSDGSGAIIDNQNQNTQDIINNNNQNTQVISGAIEDIGDQLTDQDTTQANSSISDYFTNFHVNDHIGLSGIVTAPLQFLRDILTSSSSCQPINISFDPNDSVFSGHSTWSIPCGDILWSKAPSSVVTLWYTIIWGILGYRVLVDLFRFVQRMLDPEDKSEYIMKL